MLTYAVASSQQRESACDTRTCVLLLLSECGGIVHICYHHYKRINRDQHRIKNRVHFIWTILCSSSLICRRTGAERKRETRQAYFRAQNHLAFSSSIRCMNMCRYTRNRIELCSPYKHTHHNYIYMLHRAPLFSFEKRHQAYKMCSSRFAPGRAHWHWWKSCNDCKAGSHL